MPVSPRRPVDARNFSLVVFLVTLAVLWSLSSSTRIVHFYEQNTAIAFQTAVGVTTSFSKSLASLWSDENDTASDGIPPIVLRPDVKDFERQHGVVVVSKIHDRYYMELLKQQYCLFTQAYNARMQYDIVLFTTEEIGEENRKVLQDIVAPANLTIYTDFETTIADHVSELDENQTAYLLRRCRVNSTDQLTWRTRCWEFGGGDMPLAYTWQCEFRSKWIWKHPGLAKYKYMMWMDSDTMCTKKWEQDPIAAMVRNDLVLMFDNYPQGAARGWMIQDRIQKAFNKTLCKIDVVDGHFEPQYGDCWHNTAIGGVHGMFHITNLDFFRSPPAQKWVNTLIGDGKFSRKMDDQIAVAIAPAILAPNRSWDMWENGFNLTVFHVRLLCGDTWCLSNLLRVFSCCLLFPIAEWLCRRKTQVERRVLFRLLETHGGKISRGIREMYCN